MVDFVYNWDVTVNERHFEDFLKLQVQDFKSEINL